MNVLFVTGIFAQNKRDKILGGMPKAVYMTAAGFAKRGFGVKILTAGNRDCEWEYQGIDIISVRAENFLDKDNDLQMAWAILKREIAFEREIYHVNKTWRIDVIQYAGWFGVGLLHIGRIPAVMRISSYTKVQLSSAYPANRVRTLSFLERMAARRMNAVFSPGSILAEALGKDTGINIAVIETPYVRERLQENTEVFRKKLEGKKYLLFFGRMTADKGIFVIRDILHKVLERHKDLYFVFAGTDNGSGGTQHVKEAACEYKNRVIFLGQLPHAVLFPVIRGAEAVVMPSLMDNFPNTCAEAMALGSIVIGTDGSSLEQFITDGYNGFLAERGSPESLLGQIDRCLSMDGHQIELIKANALRKVKQLDPEMYFKKLEKLYKRVGKAGK